MIVSPCRPVNDGAVMDTDANGYRLPTEAEWEYAARGGGMPAATGAFVYTYAGSNTIEDVAWYDRNSSRAAHPVGGKAANGKMDLYDMSGNVWEWCWDWCGSISAETDPAGAVSGSKRVLRGGGCGHDASYCEVSHRYDRDPGGRSSNLGFRVVCRD
jgi:formylglycine-generating enzyme required for sulfatase activity